jgi:UDP-3-O-[3-hydroxymyristoyl] glucosamine N-acyltransferase
VELPIRLADLAAELGREVEGNSDVMIHGVASLESAGPGDLAFARGAKFREGLAATRAGAVIISLDMEAGDRPTIRSPHPGLDFARATRCLVPQDQVPPGVHPSAIIDERAKVDATASIGAGCVIGERSSVGARSVLAANVTLYGDVVVGVDCWIHSGCVLRERTAIGDRVTLHPGVVLGADGFGYVPSADGVHEKVPQVGRVVVGDDVEIGANSCVDRGSLGDTSIAGGVKIDNLVQVGHGCQIGENAILCGQVGLAGSVVVERGAFLLGQAGVAGHLKIGEGVYVGAQALVHSDVEAGSRVLGSPHREARAFHRISAAWTRLPDLFRRVRDIERKLGLRGRSDDASRN